MEMYGTVKNNSCDSNEYPQNVKMHVQQEGWLSPTERASAG